MLQEWVETRGGEAFPPAFQLLAERVGVASSGGGTDTHTPVRERRGQRERVMSPTKTEPPTNKLKDKPFVLTGRFPRYDGPILLSGKEAVKEFIERHGGKVTSGLTNSTDFLVIGSMPGLKSVIEAHDRGVQIVNPEQIEYVVMNDDMAVEDLAGSYPDAAIAILLENDTQVQRSTLPQDLDKGAENAQTASAVTGHNDGTGVGHING